MFHSAHMAVLGFFGTLQAFFWFAAFIAWLSGCNVPTWVMWLPSEVLVLMCLPVWILIAWLWSKCS